MPTWPVVAVVPIRTPGTGKSRLGRGPRAERRLSRDERAALSAAMLADVAAALQAAPVDRIVAAASSAEAATAASALGLEVMVDPPGRSGLDAAVGGVTAALDGAETVLVVAADLPRLRPADVEAVLAEAAAVVVAPTADGGTGGLLRRPPRVITTAYGPGSARRHVELAAAAGVTARIVDRPGFRHDVDTWDDLRALLHSEVGAATAAFLQEFGQEAGAVNEAPAEPPPRPRVPPRQAPGSLPTRH